MTETLGFYGRNSVKKDGQNPSDLSLLRFIRAELTRGYFLEHNEAKYTERRERVYTCMRIPRELEKGLPGLRNDPCNQHAVSPCSAEGVCMTRLPLP
ncbi:hypothetical protein JZ751_006083 [Albula glossodonta]|uniref:Uncharacterized protein n=1 Tax=Albula glossodonta TaxID=121402 RepID=A0A8T2P675_9TELE|nr:hypothetical protein JZ751_006083 [Albula glossodonta]